ncbi:FAD-dependent monooxygenase [Nocardia sp. CDC159]|uniref:FAD-dependent monooxygenase n=1 Tax=Nocardia pulmonis TaxID=2951408 RepID=A0A9X2IYB9_9NOCA|nr:MULTISPECIES: FAD-dependent monooxygenase [Nocardia]MCM6775494.1 FAD-dependent monooxygenase [Nocardia pulmonis]MCM6787772.1 FAD-dependent monooxygenase [Nocardia sp. CDC159]
MSEIRTDVLISGAGPNGLLLATELALAGVRPIVLETLPGPATEPKANGLVGQVVRVLDMRALYPDRPTPLPFYIFSGLRMDFTTLTDNPMHAWMIPQRELTTLLAERARELDIEVRWQHTLTDFTQDDDGVVATVTGPLGEHRVAARFLVGADGGKSLVRKRSGIGFPGFTAADRITRVGHVEIPGFVRLDTGGYELPGYGPISWGHHWTERGMFIIAEFQPGRTLVATTEYGVDPGGDQDPMTLDELGASVNHVLGIDLPIRPPSWDGPRLLRRMVGQNTRTAERYRDRRVFLVGDAAHVHSAMGGPGLNLGMQDAINLGWKLAAHVRGVAPEGLLDTYETERRPLAERVMTSSMAQSALMAPGPEVGGLRQLFDELLGIPAVLEHIARLMGGADVRYDTGCDHPLAGRLVPDFTVETDAGPRRIAELLRSGRPLLLVVDGRADGETDGWADRVDRLVATASDAPAAALLIRPDGYVAWATGDSDDDGLRDALTRWFGPAQLTTIAAPLPALRTGSGRL